MLTFLVPLYFFFNYRYPNLQLSDRNYLPIPLQSETLAVVNSINSAKKNHYSYGTVGAVGTRTCYTKALVLNPQNVLKLQNEKLRFLLFVG